MLDPSIVSEYYSREEVASTLIELGRDREVVGVYGNGGFGSRPNVVLYPQDITSMVKSGVHEFHTSIERWHNPMSIRSDNHDSLRRGWDLILDLDCKDFSHAKLAAHLLHKELKNHGLSAISLKYTGGKGFHLGIPWESMPRKVNFKDTVLMFPDLARQAGLYLKEMMREDLEKGLLTLNTPEELSEISGVDIGKLSVSDEDNPDGSRVINPFLVVDIDPVLISPRHLFRMPYSLNKGTGYASLPINFRDLEEFQKEHANPKGLKVRKLFLQPGEEGEASALLGETVDWWALRKREEKRAVPQRLRSTERVAEDVFPPCLRNISNGLADGRKRSVFILINFLRSCNWTWADVESYIDSWNNRNKPPLAANYIIGQIRWSRQKKSTAPPPNCAQLGYYESFGVCTPDRECGESAKCI